MSPSPRPKLLVVDTSSFIYRAYYGCNVGVTNVHGVRVNAVYGFKDMIAELIAEVEPSHIVMAMDVPGGTFRNEIYTEYKAHRQPVPEDLTPQFRLIDEFIAATNIPVLGRKGVEADDIIGSVVTAFKDEVDIVIASRDKDLTQLLTEGVTMLDTMSGVEYDVEGVYSKFGVGPRSMAEWLALVGDSADNIPGAKNIGPKKAVKLLQEFGTVEGILENAHTVSGKLGDDLRASVDNIRLSLSLTVLKCDLDLEYDLAGLKFEEPDYTSLCLFYEACGFRSDAWFQNANEDQSPTYTTWHAKALEGFEPV